MAKRGDKKRTKQARQRRAAEARKEAARTSRGNPDARTVSVNVLGVGGEPVSEETIMVVIEPIRLESGDVLYFEPPFVEPFYLLKAKALRDRAEPKRLQALKNTTRMNDGTLRTLASNTLLTPSKTLR